MNKIKKGNLTVCSVLLKFVNQEIIPGTDVSTEDFWNKFDLAVHELAPINKALLEKRENIQKKIDVWHLANKGKEVIKNEYIKFLKSIEYIVEEKIDLDWRSINCNRIALINTAITRVIRSKNNCKYLEIGCDKNQTYDSIALNSEDKTGVDPAAGGNTRITSDKFFEANNNKFDVGGG